MYGQQAYGAPAAPAYGQPPAAPGAMSQPPPAPGAPQGMPGYALPPVRAAPPRRLPLAPPQEELLCLSLPPFVRPSSVSRASCRQPRRYAPATAAGAAATARSFALSLAAAAAAPAAAADR